MSSSDSSSELDNKSIMLVCFHESLEALVFTFEPFAVEGVDLIVDFFAGAFVLFESTLPCVLSLLSDSSSARLGFRKSGGSTPFGFG